MAAISSDKYNQAQPVNLESSSTKMSNGLTLQSLNQPVTGRTIIPKEARRNHLSAMLASRSAEMTSASMDQIRIRMPWFSTMGASDRSWITLVAQRGIDNFVRWLADKDDTPINPTDVFSVAPMAMTRKVSLQQTVDLVRTTISVVEKWIQIIANGQDAKDLATAVVVYSREVAFAAAEVYAKAAESRGNWDSRIEALVVDAIVRDEPDASIISRASTLGWTATGNVCVVAGETPVQPNPDLDLLRSEASRMDLSVLASVQGSRLVVVLGGEEISDEPTAIEIVTRLSSRFGSGPIVVGDIVADLTNAHESAISVSSGLRVAKAWVEGPRITSAHSLLPERALAGDSTARRELAGQVYASLSAASSDLLETCVTFIQNLTSVEATARDLFIHPNTVRYRLKKIEDVTGYSLFNERGIYTLRLAITLGRLVN